MLSGKWQPFCLGLNVLKMQWYVSDVISFGLVNLMPSIEWQGITLAIADK